MKSKEIQTAVKNKHANDDGPAKIYRNLGEVVSLQTIKLWIKMLNNTGAIDLKSPPSRPRTMRTKANIAKVKPPLDKETNPCQREKLAAEMQILRRSVQRVLHQDLGYFS